MPDNDLTGRTLAGRYDVLAALGTGGMGAVYRVRDRELDEEVALKMLREELANRPTSLERFRREVKLARRVTHRNVARTFELGHCDGVVFCTMELIDGESLRARLARENRLPPDQATAIARELCEGLAAAHRAGVIHCDIKPDNVLIASDGRVVLADFGVASAIETAAGEVAGTLAYMAPEQARGEPAGPESDIYAVGVLLFEMITGNRAFHGHHDDIARAKQATVELLSDDGGRELGRVIARATTLMRSERIASAVELGKLLAALDHTSPSAPPKTLPGGFTVRTVVLVPPRAPSEVGHLLSALHEHVLARLGQLPRVRVLPRSSDAVVPADAVIELVGTPDLVRVTIAPADGASVAMERRLAIAELEAASRAIAAAVAQLIDEPPAKPGAAMLQAEDLYLRARDHLHRGYTTSAEALDLLEQANALLPGDPRIVATLAFAHVRVAFFYSEASAQRLAHARLLVREALAVGRDRFETQLAAGHFELHTGKPLRAATHYRAAIAGAPHSSEAHEQLGRMLLEAGFLDAGLERLEAALAIEPHRGATGWEIARAWALEGRWDRCDNVIRELLASGRDRWTARLRFAWWQRDHETMARVRGERAISVHGDLERLTVALSDAILANDWAGRRTDVLAIALAPAASSRRRAFCSQLAAEVAGYFGDVPTCLDLLERADRDGAFDLHWLDRCPLLEPVRESIRLGVRERIAQRASAILDALYGDAEPGDAAETVIE